MKTTRYTRPVSRRGVSVLIGFIVGLVFMFNMIFSQVGFLSGIELKISDLLYKYPLFEQRISPKVNLIGITDYDKEVFGDKLYLREEYFRLTEALNSLGASYIVYDIIFHHQRDFDDIVALAFSDHGHVFISYNFYEKQKFAHLQKTDEEYAEGGIMSFEEKLAWVTERWSIPYTEDMGGEPHEALDINLPSGALLRSVKGAGFINIHNDVDGVIRRVPLFFYFNGRLFPHVELLLMCDYFGVSLDQLIIRFGDGIYFNPLRNATGRRFIPMDKKGNMIINFKEGESYINRSFSLSSILSDLKYGNSGSETTLDFGRLNESIALVGETATASTDLRPVPLKKTYPMVALHANMIDTILSGDFPRRLFKPFSICILLIVGLLAGYLLSQTSYAMGLFYSFLFGSLYLVTVYFYYNGSGVIAPILPPILTILFSYLLITTYFLTFEERSKKRVKALFGKHSSPEIVEELLRRADDSSLWVNRQQVTVVFVDIRGFTAISEEHSPDHVVKLLNSYYDMVSAVVMKNRGTVNKFLGDGVMAIYGAPLQSDDAEVSAILTAVDIQKRIARLNHKIKHSVGIEIGVGIGINAGEVVAGVVGGERLEYTVIGDTVNIAQRLESIAKPGQILIGQNLVSRIRGKSETFFEDNNLGLTELEPVSLKGRSEKVEVLELIW